MKALSLPVLSLSLLLAACGGGGSVPSADTINPNVTLSAAQNGTAVNLSAAASDNVGVSRVEFYRGTTLISTDTSEPYSASLTVSSADNGNVNFTARAYDAAGNSAADTRTLNVLVGSGPSTGTTLYQGVWIWALSDASGQSVVRSGLAVFDAEDTTGTYGKGKVALGDYGDARDPQNPSGNVSYTGGALFGPVSQLGLLQVRFVRDGTTPSLDILADDDDNQFEQIDGLPVFYDDDAEVRASDGTSLGFREFVMIQATTQVTGGVSATALRLQAVAPVTLKTLGGAALGKQEVSASAAAGRRSGITTSGRSSMTRAPSRLPALSRWWSKGWSSRSRSRSPRRLSARSSGSEPPPHATGRSWSRRICWGCSSARRAS